MSCTSGSIPAIIFCGMAETFSPDIASESEIILVRYVIFLLLST
jgi:hypothetical protein